MTRVFEARMAPRAVAKMAAKHRMKVIRSRFHRGQLRGSLGSSEGWGTYTGSGRGVSNDAQAQHVSVRSKHDVVGGGERVTRRDLRG